MFSSLSFLSFFSTIKQIEQVLNIGFCHYQLFSTTTERENSSLSGPFLVISSIFSPTKHDTHYMQNVMNLSKFYNSVAIDISVDGTEFHLNRLISEWWSWKCNADEVNERLLTLRLSAERQREQWSVTHTHSSSLSPTLSH